MSKTVKSIPTGCYRVRRGWFKLILQVEYTSVEIGPKGQRTIGTCWCDATENEVLLYFGKSRPFKIDI